MKWPRIIEVKDAVIPAVAYEDDDGELIVEVDETLKGKERSTAIVSAVRSHKRNLGSLVLLPIALYAWEPIKNVTRNHPGAALTTTAASVGLIATAITLPLGRDDGPSPEAAPDRTIVASAFSPTSSRSVTTSPTGGRVPRTPRTSAPARAAVTTRPPTIEGGRRPEPRPEPGPSRTREPTPKAKSTRSNSPGPEPSAGAAIEEPVPTPLRSPEATTTGAASAEPVEEDSPSGAPEPPATSTPKDGCLLGVELDPLLKVCVG